MSLLWREAARLSTQVADSPSGHPTWVERMPVSALSSYVERYRTDDEGGQRHVKSLADSYQQHGYSTRKHRGMDYWGRRGFADPADPIHLVHDENGSYLLEGNHRVRAAEVAGLESLPVLVTDMRRSV